MDLSPEAGQKIQELQSLEHRMQEILLQKQTVQLELNEVSNALDELSQSDDEVYKILSGIMVKSDKNAVTSELTEKKKIMELRIQSIEKQEKESGQQIDSLRSEIQGLIQKK